MILIAPSLLSSDFARVEEAAKIAEEAGADLLHVDIMDGHFVPNLTFGPQLVSALKAKTKLPLDVHLMVTPPHNFIPSFLDAGADWISIHLEASLHLHKDITLIKEHQRRAGIALNPATPIHLMNDIIRELDHILILSVNPGWGGQKFIASTYAKINQLHNWIKGQNLKTDIEVDGGVSLENMENLIKAGANVFVAGAAVYHSPKPREVILQMKEIARKFNTP